MPLIRVELIDWPEKTRLLEKLKTASTPADVADVLSDLIQHLASIEYVGEADE